VNLVNLILRFKHPDPNFKKEEHRATYCPGEGIIYLECCQISESEVNSLRFFTDIALTVRETCDLFVYAITVRPEAQAVRIHVF